MNNSKFAALFEGRTDRLGHNEGRSLLINPDDYQHCINEHLDGDNPIGVYPVTLDDNCRWGCIDFDHGKPASEYKTANEAQEAANLIRRVLDRLGLNCWFEISRSRGVHLWTFATEPLPARNMRRALIVAHHVVGMPYREINPKQEQLNGKIGSYVRLPYPAARTPGTQEVLWRGIHLAVKDFINMAWDLRTPPAAYERVAAMWAPAPPVSAVPEGTVKTDSDLSPLTRHILQHGPLPTADRSGTLFKLALRCRDDGLSPAETKSVLLEADGRWGKFQQANNVQQLDRIIDRVYGQVSTT